MSLELETLKLAKRLYVTCAILCLFIGYREVVESFVV